MKKIKLYWDVVIVLIIGTTLSLITLFIIYQDTIFLLAKKEVHQFNATFDDKTFQIDGDYKVDNVNYQFSKTKLDGSTYNSIKNTSTRKLFYNPQYPNQVCFENENTITWGKSLLMLIGLFVIIFITKYATTTLS